MTDIFTSSALSEPFAATAVFPVAPPTFAAAERGRIRPEKRPAECPQVDILKLHNQDSPVDIAWVVCYTIGRDHFQEQAKMSRQPNCEEMARELGLSVKTVYRVMANSAQVKERVLYSQRPVDGPQKQIAFACGPQGGLLPS